MKNLKKISEMLPDVEFWGKPVEKSEKLWKKSLWSPPVIAFNGLRQKPEGLRGFLVKRGEYRGVKVKVVKKQLTIFDLFA